MEAAAAKRPAPAAPTVSSAASSAAKGVLQFLSGDISGGVQSVAEGNGSGSLVAWQAQVNAIERRLKSLMDEGEKLEAELRAFLLEYLAHHREHQQAR